MSSVRFTRLTGRAALHRPPLHWSALPFLALLAMPMAVQAQGQPQPQPQQRIAAPPISSVPVPGELELAKLIWLTMAAVDQANQSGNYSVLRDLSAPGFQINNDPAKLTQIFAGLRAQRIDLGNTLLLAPTYTAAPQILQGGVMRVQGYFGLRPTAVVFDLYFQWVQGKWRLFGVSINPRNIAAIQPGPPTANPPERPKPEAPRR